MDIENKYYNTTISKLIINEKPIFIKIIWEDSDTNLFSIEIFLENNVWLGEYKYELAKRYIQRFKQTKEEYVMEVKSCLMKMNPMFKYDFNISAENKGLFSWKKKFEGSAVIPHGSIEVKLSADEQCSLVDCLIEENTTLRTNLDICRNEIKQYDADLRRYKYELQKMNNINASLEDTLLSKFVQLLNSKKRRIQVLEDALNNIDEG